MIACFGNIFTSVSYTSDYFTSSLFQNISKSRARDLKTNLIEILVLA